MQKVDTEKHVDVDKFGRVIELQVEAEMEKIKQKIMLEMQGTKKK